MLTYYLWENTIYKFENPFWESEPYLFEVFVKTLFTPIFILLDIFFSPVEIVSAIIYKILERKNN